MRRERFKTWKDALEKNRCMVVYVFGTITALCALVAWGMLPDLVTANPAAENMIPRPKAFMIALHAGLIAFFTFMVWKKPRELAYLTGAIISTVLFLSMLSANLGG